MKSMKPKGGPAASLGRLDHSIKWQVVRLTGGPQPGPQQELTDWKARAKGVQDKRLQVWLRAGGMSFDALLSALPSLFFLSFSPVLMVPWCYCTYISMEIGGLNIF